MIRWLLGLEDDDNQDDSPELVIQAAEAERDRIAAWIERVLPWVDPNEFITLPEKNGWTGS